MIAYPRAPFEVNSGVPGKGHRTILAGDPILSLQVSWSDPAVRPFLSDGMATSDLLQKQQETLLTSQQALEAKVVLLTSVAEGTGTDQLVEARQRSVDSENRCSSQVMFNNGFQ